MSEIEGVMAPVLALLNGMSTEARIDALNEIRLALHGVSPMASEPVDCVLWVRSDNVAANDYNPNTVAPPEMKLLEHSIREDGYTQPVVAFGLAGGGFEVVDGFHRNRVAREVPDVRERVHGRIPLAVINDERGEKKDRMAATIRHNRARGVHGVVHMGKIVAELYFNGWSVQRIERELGMDKDEVLRLKQVMGIGTLFENRDFSAAWTVAPVEDDDAEDDGDLGE